MKVEINGKLIEREGAWPVNLAELVSCLKGEAIKEGEAIISIALDERQTGIEENRTLKEVELVAISTVNSSDLVQSSLTNLAEHLERLIPVVEKAAENFRTVGAEESNAFFVQCIDGLKLFSELIDGLGRLLRIDYSEITFNEGTLKEKIENISGVLEEMHQAHLSRDWIALADALEFELAPQLEEWVQVVPQFQELLKGH